MSPPHLIQQPKNLFLSLRCHATSHQILTPRCGLRLLLFLFLSTPPPASSEASAPPLQPETTFRLLRFPSILLFFPRGQTDLFQVREAQLTSPASGASRLRRDPLHNFRPSQFAGAPASSINPPPIPRGRLHVPRFLHSQSSHNIECPSFCKQAPTRIGAPHPPVRNASIGRGLLDSCNPRNLFLKGAAGLHLPPPPTFQAFNTPRGSPLTPLESLPSCSMQPIALAIFSFFPPPRIKFLLLS